MEETGGLVQNIMSNMMMTSVGVGLAQTSKGLGLFQRRPIYEVNFHVVQPLYQHFSGVDSSVRPGKVALPRRDWRRANIQRPP